MNNLVAKAAEKLQARGRTATFEEMALTPDQADARRSANPGPLEDLFFANEGRLAHKWVHYLPVYDRVLAPFKDAAPRMLEIGVSFGGSLEMWRNYFGPKATIFGIDIEPRCAGRVDPPNQVRIGSQDDPDFLRGVVAEMGGGPNIILDDGSHIARHQRASFETLWPLLAHGGLYMIEDIHTAYWPWMEGGYRRAGTAVAMIKDLIDDQHGWHHSRGQGYALAEEIGEIRVFDSIVVIEKTQRLRPGHFRIGVEPT